MNYLALVIIFVLAYLIGNINFARIFSLAFAKKDITTVGSKNPGTMNMLRTRGLGEAFLTLFMEAIKSGLPAIICYYVMEHFYVGYGNIAFFITGFAAILGHCFPVFYKFKGGKGVACTFGMFTFHPTFWWISLIVFVVCFVLFLFVIKYGSVISFVYVTTMSVVSTVIFALDKIYLLVPVLVVIWLNLVLVFAMHHANIKRLFTGTESKVDIIAKLKKKKEVKQEENDKENIEEKENNILEDKNNESESVETKNNVDENVDEENKSENKEENKK